MDQGGLMCLQPVTYYYENLLAFFYSVDEINKNPAILPNLTLGYHIYDSCADPRKAIKSILQILSGPGHIVPNYSCTRKKKVVGFIGDHFSLTTLPVAQFLGIYPYSQISYGATDTLLSDRRLFPSFFRTVPDDQRTFSGICHFLRYLGWTWVGIISSEDEAGEREVQVLINLLASHDICVAFVMKGGNHASDNMARNIAMIKKSSARVVITCGGYTTFLQFIYDQFNHVLHDKILILTPTFAPNIGYVIQHPQVFNLSLLFVERPGKAPNMEHYFKSFHPRRNPKDMILETFWIILHKCLSGKAEKDDFFSKLHKISLRKCDGTERIDDLLDMSFKRTYSQMYSAVGTMVFAVNHMYNVHKHQSTAHQLYQYAHSFSDSPMHNRVDVCAPALGEGDTCTNRQRSQGSVKRCRSWEEQEEKLGTPENFGLRLPRSLFRDEALPIYQKTMSSSNNLHGKNFLNQKYIRNIHLRRSAKHYESHVMEQSLLLSEDSSVVDLVGYPPTPVEDIKSTVAHSLMEDKDPGMQCPRTHVPLLFCLYIPQSRCSARCSPGQRRVTTSSIHMCCYDCARCSEGEISNISDSENCRKCPEDAWSNENRTLCVMKEMEYLSYTEDIISIAFSSLATFFWILIIFIILTFVANHNKAIVRANNKNLSFVLLVSIMLSFLSVFLFLGRPVDTTCRIRQISTGILLSISISSLLAKTIMVYMAFRATKPGSVWSRWSGVTLPNCVLLICSSVQGVICMSWVTLSPPFQELDTHSYKEKMVVQCNEGSDLWFYSVLGYMGILAAVSFITAFLARTLPDSFNEAKYITFSMLVFCSVWIAMIPAYLSTKGKYMVAVEIFAILTSNAGLLGCIFFPKCYIILFKPELNTRKHILGCCIHRTTEEQEDREEAQHDGDQEDKAQVLVIRSHNRRVTLGNKNEKNEKSQNPEESG
ncbi:vomeronasal type-2 receptor 26-like [Dendropsophus ebraccatus]|uniref:vomeronasal type-2 receptor 26-like n=1 Tax=Dendropsophus ebraccatus TaxID=150705 RepID=UPI003832285C